MKATTLLLGLSLLTVGTLALVGTASAQQSPGACVQANTYVIGMAHSCPLGYPQWPKDPDCYYGYYQSYIGERTGVLVWWC